jgi:hypothetical protein
MKEDFMVGFKRKSREEGLSSRGSVGFLFLLYAAVGAAIMFDKRKVSILLGCRSVGLK